MRSAILGLALSLALVLAAANVAATGQSWTRVRAIHASPDAPAVDIWANGAPLFEGAGFKDVTDYAKVKPGMYNVQVVPAGATTPVVIEADLDLMKRMDYTIIAIDNLKEIKPLVLADNRFHQTLRKSAVRFVHASPDAPAVDIKVDGEYLIKGLEFGKYTGYKRVTPGTYDIQILVAGTDTVALDLQDIKLKRGTMYTALAVGQLSDSSLDALLVMDRKR